PNILIFQPAAVDLVVEGARVVGVLTQGGVEFRAPAVVLTVGTFLKGLIHVGDNRTAGGRAGEAPSEALALRLRALGLPVGRLKTGTPPRLDGRTIDYNLCQEQPGDSPTPVFSFMGSVADHPRQVSCWITHTNEATHDIIRAGLHRSPLYGGVIEGVGPRYCPSVEDKVVRFADKTAHQVFLEPEGLDTFEVYPNGISTSLPFDVQIDLVRSIKGLERVHITRPGYAIEYDFFDPRALHYTLETRALQGLYFAGQINGTTGYEEAAAQGLLAGVNAALAIRGGDPWYPRRDQAYLGVLIDDLITRGADEPYRMFTSRAEHRLLLREDNADLRLTEVGRQLGLVDDARWRQFTAKRDAIGAELTRLQTTVVRPKDLAPADAQRVLGGPLSREYRATELLCRPEVDYAGLVSLPAVGDAQLALAAAEQVEIQCKYQGYIDRQRAEIAGQQRLEHTLLPLELDYRAVAGLSSEVRERLARARPTTLGQASRLPGVTPAAVSLLAIHLRRSTGRHAPEPTAKPA
ncbi:MAG: tRNA uridine-5-carboxymethylaminomethyl(34) synthesis enzyme MnmG, partial [Candidatus Competibacterales bacterium]